jgi:hypothetical protein
MTPSVPRETFVQATRDLPEVRITEVVLQTALAGDEGLVQRLLGRRALL